VPAKLEAFIKYGSIAKLIWLARSVRCAHDNTTRNRAQAHAADRITSTFKYPGETCIPPAFPV